MVVWILIYKVRKYQLGYLQIAILANLCRYVNTFYIYLYTSQN